MYVSSSPLLMDEGYTFQQMLPGIFFCWSFHFSKNMFVPPTQAAFQNVSGADSTPYPLTFFQPQSISSSISGQYQDGMV